METDIDKATRNVVQLLTRMGRRISTAESCTGGMLSAAITSVGGSSEVFELGICNYSNRIKADVLGVSWETLEQYGAVSGAVAEQMAKNAARLSGSDYAVSTTGFAGPAGGTAQNPVGTVYIGFYNKEKNLCTSKRFVFGTENCPSGISARDFIRRQATLAALNMTLQFIV